MEEAEWMWAVLDRMEQDAKPWGWTAMIDQINVTRRILAAEASRMPDPAPGIVVHVDFKLRRQIHILDAGSF
jgi:hypothetical protein